MNCWHCKSELQWGSDHTDEDDESYMITYLTCKKCPCRVEVYYNTDAEENPQDDTVSVEEA